MIVVPSVTWPSEAIATRPLWRTQTTVVACHFSFFFSFSFAIAAEFTAYCLLPPAF